MSRTPGTYNRGKPQGAHPRNKPFLSNRCYRFSNAEASAVNAPIQAFWRRIAGNKVKPKLEDLLGVERQAFEAAGQVSDDMEEREIASCRRNLLQCLGPSRRQDYADLLCSIGKMHSKREEHDLAYQALAPFASVARDEWQALSNLAIVKGLKGSIQDIRLALQYFNIASEALKSYQQKYEIDEVELWEAAVYEARFRAIFETHDNPDISIERLNKILQPIFEPPEQLEGIQEFAVQEKERTLEALIRNSVPLQTLAAVVTRDILGETKFVALESLGEVTDSFSFVLEVEAAKEKPAACEDVLRWFNKVKEGLGQRAVALYTWVRIDRIISRREERSALDKARALLQEAERGGFLLPQAAAEIKEVLDDLAEKVRVKEILQEIERGLRSSKSVRTAINRASDIWETEEALRPQLRTLFERCLEDSAKQEVIRKEIKKIRNNITQAIDITYNDASRMKIKKGRSAAGLLSSIPPSGNTNYRGWQRTYDFIFVNLQDLESVQSLSRELDAYHAVPVCLDSVWYQVLSEKAQSSKDKRNILEKALEADENNKVAEMKLLEDYLNSKIEREQADAEKAAKELLAPDVVLDPLLKLRTACILVRHYAQRAKEAAGHHKVKVKGKKKKTGRSFEDNLAEAKSVFSQIEEMGRGIGSADLAHQDWNSILNYLADIHVYAYDFEAALRYYDQILEKSPTNQLAVVGKSIALVLQGDLYEAVDFMQNKIREAGEEPAYDRDKMLAFNALFAEILIMRGRNLDAAMVANNALSLARKFVNSHLALARTLALKGETSRAEVSLSRAEELASQQELPVSSRINFEGLRALARAEIEKSRGDRTKARTAFENAIRLYSNRPDERYKEAMTKYFYITAILEWAREDFRSLRSGRKMKEADIAKLAEEGLTKARALVEKYPFYPPARNLVIAALIFLGQEANSMKHFPWFSQNIHGVDPDLITNLIILTIPDGDQANMKEVQRQARGLLSAISEKLNEQYPNGRGLIIYAKAQEQVLQIYPDWEPDGDLSVLFGE